MYIFGLVVLNRRQRMHDMYDKYAGLTNMMSKAVKYVSESQLPGNGKAETLMASEGPHTCRFGLILPGFTVDVTIKIMP